MDDKEKYGRYDEIVNTILKNILVERERCGKILLWDFNPVDHGDRLYFNVAAIIADLNKEPIYLNMPLFDYLKFKWKRRKSRKNLRYFGPNHAAKLDDEYKTSIYLITDFVCEQLNVSRDLLKEINDTYYGWY
jgi:hypothetical protein